MRPLACLLLALIAGLGWAQPRLPQTFDANPGWTQRPTFLPNPTSNATVVVGDGANALTVNEVGKGMKFELPVQALDSGYYPYLVLRYKAANLGLAGYTLWAMDGTQTGLELINPHDLIVDGQWHAIAVDLAMRGVIGAVRGLVFEVQCAQAPASLTLDAITLQDEVSEHTKIVPEAPPEAPETLVKAAEQPRPEAQHGWLSARAEKYGADVQDGAVHLWAEGQDVGMKFSVKLKEPVDLTPVRFAAVRYKARGTAPWGDYFVWLGSDGGGMPDQYARVMEMPQLKNDGEWHVALVPVKGAFKATDMALEVSSAKTRGDVWLDWVRFVSKRPMVDMADVLPYQQGWDGSRLKQFRSVPFAPNASAASRLRANSLKSWFTGQKVSFRGIPFSLYEDAAKNVLLTPVDISAPVASISVGGTAATEAYLLMLGRLPSVDACRMGDPVPMEAFQTPERFRVRVAYADGVSDEVFPIACGSGEFAIVRGPEVYCLPGLRPVPIQRLELVNRMDSGNFMVAGVTLNEGRAVTAAAKVQELPVLQRQEPMDVLCSVPSIKPKAGGFVIQSTELTMDLQTEGGVKLRSLVGDLWDRGGWSVEPGPLFEIGDGKTLLDSTQVTVGKPTLDGPGVDPQGRHKPGKYTLTVPFTGAGISGSLIITAGADTKLGLHPDIAMQLDLTNASGQTIKPVVNFPLVRNVKIGSVDDTWYLYTRKGGLVSNRPTSQKASYGGQHPLQVDDIFNPRRGEGLALLTYDLKDVYRTTCLTKDEAGVSWRVEYWQQEVPPGAKIETVPTALRAHYGDWRTALGFYQQWVKTWFKPMVPRKRWFQEVFYYQQSFAWGDLRDAATGQWRMSEYIKRCKDAFGCLDYLHVFDFGESRIYGRVGDYNHYEELGGLPAMRAAFKEAQDQGVRMGIYIEGYLCDNRGVWGKPNVPGNALIQADGKPLMWTGSTGETMMCPAAQPWREHLADCYRRVAGELQPDGMYTDQFGFLDTWKTCWSREHGHPVPNAPIRGEGGTTQAIRAAMPPAMANLTEETPNDVHAQYQDGALGYSVVSTDSTLAPHRVDFFRFAFPDFKVFQLVCYNAFTEGGWDLLKWPFFNGEAIWLQGDPQRDYCDDARNFLKQSFAILHQYKDAFCSQDVKPLVPTLMPTVYANEFRGPKATAWTLYNAEFRTIRGDLLSVRHRDGVRYVDAFTGREIKARTVKGQDLIPVAIGPRDVGCVVAEQGR